MNWTFDPQSDGCRVIDESGHFVARVTNKNRVEKREIDGHPLVSFIIAFEPMPRADWTIHFTGGPKSVGVLESILANLPGPD
mgnify:CR=1 FL=1